MADSQPLIPPGLTARLAHPAVRLSGPIDGAAAAAFLDQILPVLVVPGSIVSSYSVQEAMLTLGVASLRKCVCYASFMVATCGFSARR